MGLGLGLGLGLGSGLGGRKRCCCSFGVSLMGALQAGARRASATRAAPAAGRRLGGGGTDGRGSGDGGAPFLDEERELEVDQAQQAARRAGVVHHPTGRLQLSPLRRHGTVKTRGSGESGARHNDDDVRVGRKRGQMSGPPHIRLRARTRRALHTHRLWASRLFVLARRSEANCMNKRS